MKYSFTGRKRRTTPAVNSSHFANSQTAKLTEIHSWNDALAVFIGHGRNFSPLPAGGIVPRVDG